MDLSLEVTALVTDDVAVVEIGSTSYGSSRDVFYATGSAKRHPNDYSDDELGFDLAMSRALRSLADEYDKLVADMAPRNMSRTELFSKYFDFGNFESRDSNTLDVAINAVRTLPKRTQGVFAEGGIVTTKAHVS